MMFSPNQRRAPINWTDFPEQQQPQGGFVWGKAGTQLSGDDIAGRLQVARAMMKGDYSPVRHWAQGAARFAENIFGALQTRDLEKKQAEADADAQARIVAALGKDADLATLFTGGDKAAAAVAQSLLEMRNPKPQAPTEFERTLRGAGIDPASQQGIALYAQRANTMALPQPQFISNGPGMGGQWVTPPAITQGGGDPSASAGGPPPTLPPDFDFGGPASAPGTFPAGNPLERPR